MFFKSLFLIASLEFGFINGGVHNYNYYNATWNGVEALYANLQTEVSYKCFYINGEVNTFFTPITLTSYVPFQMDYTIELGIKLDSVQLAYEHSCFHPISPYSTIIGNEIKPKYEGGLDKIYIKISTK